MKLPSARYRSVVPFLAATLLILNIVAWWADYSCRHLGRPVFVTGWWLFAVLLVLGAFNSRKKLSMLPLGNASTWLRWHITGGFVVLALFWLHTRTLWPAGLYERVIAGVFYLVTFSGILGWLMQRIYPHALSDSGVEVIYERIPDELAQLRQTAETLVIDCAKATGSDTLGHYYTDALHWFFRRPRFFWDHAFFGGKQARTWVRKQCLPVRLYLNEPERKCLDRIGGLADRKADLDFHYAAQSLMKRWLLVHLPLTALLMLLVGWHILLIFIYAS